VEVEDEVEFAYIAEIFIKDLYEGVNEFKDDELVIVFVDDGDEVETGVSLVDDLVLFVVNEIAHFGFPGDDQLVDLNIRATLPLSGISVFPAVTCSTSTILSA